LRLAKTLLRPQARVESGCGEARGNVIVSPHVAAEQAPETLDGTKSPRLIQQEVWPACRGRFERIMGFEA
jgi:hypothetical protein